MKIIVIYIYSCKVCFLFLVGDSFFFPRYFVQRFCLYVLAPFTEHLQNLFFFFQKNTDCQLHCRARHTSHKNTVPAKCALLD